MAVQNFKLKQQHWETNKYTVLIRAYPIPLVLSYNVGVNFIYECCDVQVN